MKNATLTKHVDSKGRVTLGEAYANTTVIVEARGSEVVITRARVIPEQEAWLYDNQTALNLVRRGLKQAAEGDFVAGPDLRVAAGIVEHLQED